MVNKVIGGNSGEKIYQWISICCVVFVSLISLYPLLYVLTMSVVTEAEMVAKRGAVYWPSNPTLAGYERLLETTVFSHGLMISVLKTAIGTALTLTLTTILAYVASRKKMPGNRILIFSILITVLFSGGLIPTFVVVRDLNLLNSFWALIVPGALYSWGALVLLQFFKNLPTEMEESARIDGAGEATMMLKIMLPMCAPAMAAIGLFIAVNHWNAWFDALIYVNDTQLYPIQLIIRNMLENAELGNDQQWTMDMSTRVSSESLKMAAVVFGTVPILCVYPFLQKYFIKGMFLGAVKG